MGRIVNTIHQSNSNDGDGVSSSFSSFSSFSSSDDEGGFSNSVRTDSSFSHTTTVDSVGSTIITSRTIPSDGDETVVVTRVEGGPGDDQIVVESESGAVSTIEAGSGDDAVVAGAGDDTIDGGPGWDLLSGGEGADTFRVSPGSTLDIVTDFEQGVDKIDVSAFGFDSFAALAIDGNVIDLGNGDVVVVLGVDELDGSDVTL